MNAELNAFVFLCVCGFYVIQSKSKSKHLVKAFFV